jgi:hypothetical protein
MEYERKNALAEQDALLKQLLLNLGSIHGQLSLTEGGAKEGLMHLFEKIASRLDEERAHLFHLQLEEGCPDLEH